MSFLYVDTDRVVNLDLVTDMHRRARAGGGHAVRISFVVPGPNNAPYYIDVDGLAGNTLWAWAVGQADTPTDPDTPDPTPLVP